MKCEQQRFITTATHCVYIDGEYVLSDAILRPHGLF